jgi:hypothetical protein
MTSEHQEPFSAAEAAPEPGASTITTASDVAKSLSGSGASHGSVIISVTLLTGPADILIGDALNSVASWVERCLVLYPKGLYSAKASLRVAWQAVGSKLVVQQLQEYHSNDLGGLCNSSMQWARALGADWALLLPADAAVQAGESAEILQAVAAAGEAEGATHINCLHTYLGYYQVCA